MSVKILGGHAIDVLNTLPENHFHVVCTSPPYLWLRSYSTTPQVWAGPDGTPLCGDGVHEWDEYRRVWDNRHAAALAQQLEERGLGGKVNPDRSTTGATCARCGAWRGELGSEPTPELFIGHLVQVFDAVRRVLRPDGTCWVNLAGSYVNNPGGQNGSTGGVSERAQTAARQNGRQDRTSRLAPGGWLKPLDYLDTPGLFAHAMQVAGWYWRADIALVKKAPMPESVQGTRWERCRVKVTGQEPRGSGLGTINGRQENNLSTRNIADLRSATRADCPGCPRCEPNDGLVLRRGNGRPTRAWERFLVFAKQLPAYWDSQAVREDGEPEQTAHNLRYAKVYDAYEQKAHNRQPGNTNHLGIHSRPGPGGHNLRNWIFWPQNTLKEAHYASFSPDLAALAIKAGTSERCCTECGAPWARVVKTHYNNPGNRTTNGPRSVQNREFAPGFPARLESDTQTLGWRPTCSHPAAARVPARVLDPFFGAGSTGLAADRLGRDCTGIDLNAEYTRIAVRRVTQDAPLFADVTLG